MSASTKVAAGTRVLHVKRGNLEVVFPITRQAFVVAPAHELARRIVALMLREQLLAPGRASDPLPTDDTQLALRVHGRDAPLDPDLSLREQTEGHWQIRKLPVQGQREQLARLPVCELEVIDVARPAIYLP